MTTRRILVTGSTGYVGGRVVPALLEAGHQVRCLVRTPAKLAAAPWISQVEVVAGSVDDDLSLAMANCDVAIYLIHSIGEGDNWAEREITHAENFAAAAKAAGVQRIVYLGGLGAARSSSCRGRPATVPAKPRKRLRQSSRRLRLRRQGLAAAAPPFPRHSVRHILSSPSCARASPITASQRL